MMKPYTYDQITAVHTTSSELTGEWVCEWPPVTVLVEDQSHTSVRSDVVVRTMVAELHFTHLMIFVES